MNNCAICGATLHEDRVEALKSLNTHPANWACVSHDATPRVRGVFSGEYGTSKLIIASGVGHDGIERGYKD